jgi:nitrite reductase/ring-hydroxylating ferredoxin subunit
MDGGRTRRRLNGDTHVAVKPPAYASGWYAVALERELKSGSVITRKLAGREIMLFRTVSGKVVAAEPYCPHLGAHIGRGGKVLGELVVCPFHGFGFDTSGACVNTPYGPPPSGASLQTLPVFIYLDVIMVHHGLPDKPAPSAPELPALDGGWGRVKFKRMHTNAYHLDILENSFDVGHLSAVHRFSDASVATPLQIQEMNASTEYSMTRILPFNKRISLNARVTLYGLGLAVSEISLGAWKIRQLSLPTPADRREADIIVGIAVHKRGTSGWARTIMIPVEFIARSITLKLIMSEYRRDFKIWESKVYLDRPKLARNEGSIGKYRQWARRFYVADPPVDVGPSVTAFVNDKDQLIAASRL